MCACTHIWSIHDKERMKKRAIYPMLQEHPKIYSMVNNFINLLREALSRKDGKYCRFVDAKINEAYNISYCIIFQQII